MYSKGLFGQFYPVKSLMHKINPSIKLICFFITFILMCFTNYLGLHLFIFLMICFLIFTTKVPVRFFFNIFYSLRYLYILILILGASISLPLSTVLIFIFKIIIIVLYLALISYTTSISELSYGIAVVLEPFNLFNFKLGEVSFFITSLIKFYPMFVNNNTNNLKAGASRGIDYNHSGIIGRYYALIKCLPSSIRKTFKEIKDTKNECKLRLFNINKKRSNINHNKLGFYDIILLAFHLLFLCAYILEAGLIR